MGTIKSKGCTESSLDESLKEDVVVVESGTTVCGKVVNSLLLGVGEIDTGASVKLSVDGISVENRLEAETNEGTASSSGSLVIRRSVEVVADSALELVNLELIKTEDTRSLSGETSPSSSL